MKIVFFSDVHGNIRPLKKMFEMLENIEHDEIIFGGDIFGYYYNAKEAMDLLNKKNVRCLLGNHDQMLLDLYDGKIEKDYLISRYGNSYRNILNELSDDDICTLRSRKSIYELSIDNKKYVFVHGSLADPLNGRVYPDTDISDADIYKGIDYVFCGHTHHKMERIIGNTKIINPGSIGQQRDGKGCSFIVFDTISDSYNIYIAEYNIEELETEINKNDSGAMRDKLIEVLHRSNKNNKWLVCNVHIANWR